MEIGFAGRTVSDNRFFEQRIFKMKNWFVIAQFLVSMRPF